MKAACIRDGPASCVCANMNVLVQNIMMDLYQRLRRVYGPRLIRLVLFGSQARGDASDDSDIDALVILEGHVDPCVEIARTEFDVASLSLENDRVILCLFVSEDEYARGETPVIMNATREGVAI